MKKSKKNIIMLIMIITAVLLYAYKIYSVNKEYKDKYFVDNIFVKNSSTIKISKYKCSVKDAILYEGTAMKNFVKNNKNKFALLDSKEYDEDFDIVGILYIKMSGIESVSSKLVLKVGQIAKESPMSKTGEFCYELTREEVSILKKEGIMLGDYAYLFKDKVKIQKNQNDYFGFNDNKKRFIFKLDSDFIRKIS